VTWRLRCAHHQHKAGPARINWTWVTGSLSASGRGTSHSAAECAVMRLDAAFIWKVREDTFEHAGGLTDLDQVAVEPWRPAHLPPTSASKTYATVWDAASGEAEVRAPKGTPHRSPSLSIDMDANRAGFGSIPSTILTPVSSQNVMYGIGDGDVRSCGAGARTG
jgi:hypothetical protein